MKIGSVSDDNLRGTDNVNMALTQAPPGHVSQCHNKITTLTVLWLQHAEPLLQLAIHSEQRLYQRYIYILSRTNKCH